MLEKAIQTSCFKTYANSLCEIRCKFSAGQGYSSTAGFLALSSKAADPSVTIRKDNDPDKWMAQTILAAPALLTIKVLLLLHWFLLYCFLKTEATACPNDLISEHTIRIRSAKGKGEEVGTSQNKVLVSIQNAFKIPRVPERKYHQPRRKEFGIWDSQAVKVSQ